MASGTIPLAKLKQAIILTKNANGFSDLVIGLYFSMLKCNYIKYSNFLFEILNSMKMKYGIKSFIFYKQ